MPPRKVPRCVYTDGRNRCKRPGTSSPALCDAHRIVFEAEAARPQRPGENLVGLLGRLFRGQKISDEALYGGLEDVVDMFSRPPEDPRSPIGAAQARAAEWARQHAPRPQARERQAPPPRKPPGQDPRIVLGFAAGQKITMAELKRRHRELARKHHPDRGGSASQMSAVNDAVDRLVAELKST